MRKTRNKQGLTCRALERCFSEKTLFPVCGKHTAHLGHQILFQIITQVCRIQLRCISDQVLQMNLVCLWQHIKLLTWSRTLILYGNKNVLLVSTEWYAKYWWLSFTRNSFQQNNSHQLQKLHLYAQNLSTVMQPCNYIQRRHFILFCGTLYLLKSKRNFPQFSQKRKEYERNIKSCC